MSGVTAVEVIPPNPGGTLPPSQVLGRDSLIARYWQELEQQSLALFSARRVGKTSVLRRMAHESHPGWRVRLRDLEGLDSAEAFTQFVYEDARELLSASNKTLTRVRAFLQRVSGSVELSNVKVTLAGENWRRLLESLFEDLEEELTNRDERLVFLWDEFTLFIGDMATRGMGRDAMILLDTLRAARQRHLRIRMVLTGSISFPLVVRLLEAQGYRNRPINDVRAQQLPMLAQEEAAPLIKALLRGIGTKPQALLTEAIFSRSEGHPFVIHHLVERLRGVPQAIVADVDAALAKLLAPPSVLDLGHYVGRLSKYYGDRETTALAILDLLAPQPEGLHFDELVERLGMGRTEVLPTLQDLRNDDYIVQEDRRMRFSLELVRRFWCEERMV